MKYILFVFELCSGGDLLGYVRNKKRLNEKVAKYAFKQIIEAVHYCHKKGVIHRDIKLDNVLLNCNGDIKLCDFGVSKKLVSGEKITEQCGTPAYIAPEVIKGKGYYGFASDIWSSGVLLYTMLFGTIPFKAHNMKDLHKQIKKAKYNLKNEISSEAQNLIKSMLITDPNKRITIPEILNHSWLNDTEKIELFSEEERTLLKKEISYKSSDANSSELFTEKEMDSSMNDLTRNHTSKSNVLAPFNSSCSEVDELEDNENDEKLENKKNIIKFDAKVRDADRQYEKNNNCDNDNGVYNKFVCDSSQSKGESISSYKSEFDSLLSDYEDNDKKDNPFEETVDDKMEIIPDVLKQLEDLKFDPKRVVESLEKMELNHATTTYFLLYNE